MNSRVIALVALLALSACAEKPAPMALDYGAINKMSLSTQDFFVIDRSRGALAVNAPTDISWQYEPSVAKAITRWGQNKLQASGTSGHAALVIKDAGVKIHKVPTSIAPGYFAMRQQESKYVARVDIVVQADSTDGTRAWADAYSTYSVALPEDPSDTEQRIAYIRVLEGVIRGLDQATDKAMKEHMGAFVAATEIVQPPVIAPLPASSDRIYHEDKATEKSDEASSSSKFNYKPTSSPVGEVVVEKSYP